MRGSVAAAMTASMALLGVSMAPSIAGAHVGVSSGPATAKGSAVVTFSVGHGCEKLDTYKVRVEIPQSVTALRAMGGGELGPAVLERDAAGLVRYVTWTKPAGSVQAEQDDIYYALNLRITVPDLPFTKVYFPIIQTCRAPDGTEKVTNWTAINPVPNQAEATGMEPAAELVVLPARKAGWNKFTVPAAVADLAPYFADAEIVWKGTAAYSSNTATQDQIKATQGVTALSSLAAGDEIWVKY